jgi:hypothetical protein
VARLAWPTTRVSAIARRGGGEPGEGAIDHHRTRALRLQPPRDARHLVVVGGEAAVEAVAVVEDEGAHERGRTVAGGAQVLGERGQVGGQRALAVVAQTVPRRQQAGQHGGMAGQGERHGRLRLIEAHARGGERVERRRVGRRAAVAAEAIGAQRVEGDEQQVPTRGGGRRGRPAGGRGDEQGERSAEQRCETNEANRRRGAPQGSRR